MDVNSVSGEKLHDFEIICPARGVRSHLRTPLLRTGLYHILFYLHARHVRKGLLSLMRKEKARKNLQIHAVSPAPSLFAKII